MSIHQLNARAKPQVLADRLDDIAAYGDSRQRMGYAVGVLDAKRQARVGMAVCWVIGSCIGFTTGLLAYWWLA